MKKEEASETTNDRSDFHPFVKQGLENLRRAAKKAKDNRHRDGRTPR